MVRSRPYRYPVRSVYKVLFLRNLWLSGPISKLFLFSSGPLNIEEQFGVIYYVKLVDLQHTKGILREFATEPSVQNPLFIWKGENKNEYNTSSRTTTVQGEGKSNRSVLILRTQFYSVPLQRWWQYHLFHCSIVVEMHDKIDIQIVHSITLLTYIWHAFIFVHLQEDSISVSEES